MKLANFLALDPDYPGAGLKRGSRLDGEVWEAWADRRDECRVLAASIRAGVATSSLPPSLDDDEGRPEGAIVLTEHHRRERNRTVVRKRKEQLRNLHGQLVCEACGVTEQETRSRYGPTLGDIFECHHLVPLAEVVGSRRPKPEDLAVLCPTCHRAVHRIFPMPAVATLQQRLSS
jgi:5-methylcytosine-specific restriction protein A